MQLVEQHCIGKADPRFAAIDRTAFASKNLYNAALYELRQAYIFRGERLCYEEVYHRMKTHEAYKALPAKVAQQVLKQLDKAWKGYFAACEAWEEDPSKFLGHPKLPRYQVLPVLPATSEKVFEQASLVEWWYQRGEHRDWPVPVHKQKLLRWKSAAVDLC
jgi:putative transposase